MSRLSSERVREIVFLAVGASTPIGILAVNGSAFVMQHLSQFALGIAVCALVSGLSLNGFTAWMILVRAERFAPQLFAEYRVWALSAAAVGVAASAGVGAYLTYWSMLDARTLPNLWAVLTAVWLLLLPVLMTVAARRLKDSVQDQERVRAAAAAKEVAVRRS